MPLYFSKISSELNILVGSVKTTLDLLDSGCTIPFIARYRKEATGSLDEVAVTSIRDRWHQLQELDKRRAVILASLKEQKKLTKELEEKVLAAETMTVL